MGKRTWAAVRPFTSARWILFHLLVWTAAATMVGLGRWQLQVSNRRHFDLQNFGYAFQWWAFTLFALFFWLKAMRNVRHPPTPPSAGSELALRSSGRGMARFGPADLVVRSAQSDRTPVVYRGYLMPQSSASPPRSDGDDYHAAYNDQLWQLALSDAARADRSENAAPDVQPPTRVIDVRPEDPPG